MAQQRLYERVANELAAEIASGTYVIGQRLPSERDLAARFGVSRPTMREAVIALEIDGMVEVKTGSGVYLRALHPQGEGPARADIGPFELLQARAMIESEVAALAATLITDEEITQLAALVDEMEAENRHDVVMSEDADRRFHLAIANATKNSALILMVETLWDVRVKSPQSVRLLERVRAQGVKPRIDEHAAVMNALRRRDPQGARQAMRAHLEGVIEAVFEATESEAVERARAEIAEKRKRYAMAGGAR